MISGKSMSELTASSRQDRLEKKAYSERMGAINVGRSARGDTIAASQRWILGRGIRLVLVIVFYPAIEIFF
jgi:hypothetical protein